MTEKPPHRWYQFRLSTVLILIAITAWTIALPAYVPGPPKMSDIWPIPAGRPIELQLNRDLVWTTIALAAFLLGKAARAIVERTRMNAATPLRQATWVTRRSQNTPHCDKLSPVSEWTVPERTSNSNTQQGDEPCCDMRLSWD